MTIELNKTERAELIAAARKELVDKLYRELCEDLQTISKSQLAGMLDVDGRTVEALGIPRLPLAGKLVKYKLSTVAKWMKQREER